MKKVRKQQYRKLLKICKINYVRDDFEVIGHSFCYKCKFKVIEDMGYLSYNNDDIFVFRNKLYYRGKHFATFIYGLNEYGRKYPLKENVFINKYEKLLKPCWIREYHSKERNKNGFYR